MIESADNNLNFVLTIQIPGHMQQFHVMCFDLAEVRKHIDTGMATGRVETCNEVDGRLLVLHVIPGTVYFALRKKDHERAPTSALCAAKRQHPPMRRFSVHSTQSETTPNTPDARENTPPLALLADILRSVFHSIAPGSQQPLDGEAKVLQGLSEVIGEMMTELRNYEYEAVDPDIDEEEFAAMRAAREVVLRARIETMRRIRRSFEDALYEVDTSEDLETDDNPMAGVDLVERGLEADEG